MNRFCPNTPLSQSLRAWVCRFVRVGIYLLTYLLTHTHSLSLSLYLAALFRAGTSVLDRGYTHIVLNSVLLSSSGLITVVMLVEVGWLLALAVNFVTAGKQ